MNFLLDSYIVLHEYVKQTIPKVREYLEYIGLCKKYKSVHKRTFQGINYIVFKRNINKHVYFRVIEEFEKINNQNYVDMTIVPLDKKPFIYIHVIHGDQYLDIYDFMKGYFVKGNFINRNLLEFIVYEHLNIDLSKEDYKIHMFTNNAELQVYTKIDNFCL